MAGQVLCVVLLACIIRANTLTVGEGEQFASPQQAIDAVSDGDTIFIRAGTYEFSDSIELWGHNDIRILGEEGTVLICDSRTENVMWIINCDRITVSGISATHTQPSEDERCYGNVIGIDGCNSVTIENCEINGCGAIGVYTSLVDAIVLRNNFIHDNTLWAVQHEGNGLLLESHYIDGLTMEGNTILNNGGRQLDTVFSTGTTDAEFSGVSNDHGYLIFHFRNPAGNRIDSCYVVPGCEGPWQEIYRNHEDYMGMHLEYEWREVLTIFMLYDYGEEITEITSISIPD